MCQWDLQVAYGLKAVPWGSVGQDRLTHDFTS